MTERDERIEKYREQFGKGIISHYNAWVDENRYDDHVLTRYDVLAELVDKIERANSLNKASELLNHLMDWSDWDELKESENYSDAYFTGAYPEYGIPYAYLGRTKDAIDYCLDESAFLDWLDEQYGDEDNDE